MPKFQLTINLREDALGHLAKKAERPGVQITYITMYKRPRVHQTSFLLLYARVRFHKISATEGENIRARPVEIKIRRKTQANDKLFRFSALEKRFVQRLLKFSLTLVEIFIQTCYSFTF